MTIVLTGWSAVSLAQNAIEIQVAEGQAVKIVADLGAPPQFKQLRNVTAGCEVGLGDTGQSDLKGFAISPDWQVVQVIHVTLKHEAQTCPLLFGRIQREGEDNSFILLGDTTTQADGSVFVSYTRYGDKTEDQIRKLVGVLMQLGPGLPAFPLPLHLEPIR